MENHIIRKQVLDIRLPKKAGAIEQQEAIRSLYWEQIVPAMDQAFSRIAPKGKTLRLESLTVDIGSVPLEDLATEITKQLTEQLIDLVRRTAYSHLPDTNGPGKPTQQASGLENSGPLILSGHPSRAEALYFFLRNGIFPWWFSPERPVSPPTLLQDLSVKEVKSLIKLLRKPGAANMLKRLSVQFQTKQLLVLAEKSEPELSSELRAISELFSTFSSPGAVSISSWQRSVDQAVKSTILQALIQGFAGRQSSVELIDHAIGQLTTHSRISERRLQKLIINQLTDNPSPEAVLLANRLRSTIKSSETNGANSNPPRSTRTEDRDGSGPEYSPAISTTKNEGIPDQLQVKEKTTSQNTGEHPGTIREAMEGGLYIENAGIVILAPFLQRYFKNLGLIENRNFIGSQQQERALLLLQHLATGHTSFPENELLLNKILTGWSLEEPLPSSIELTEKEKHESDDLLQSLIQHWGALGNSSPDALRETFLLREGKLVEKENQYLLLVERRSLDLLMDRIPWSFSVIKLPWMEKQIQVEW